MTSIQSSVDAIDEILSTMESRLDLFTQETDAIFADLREFGRREEAAMHRQIRRLTIGLSIGLVVVLVALGAWYAGVWR